MLRRWLWILIPFALLAAGATVWSLRTRSVRTVGSIDLGTLPRGVSRDRLNLVVITLDTTRADRIGAYGAGDVETPALDRLANEGVLFEQAVSAASLTLPWQSSILPVKFPPERGVRDNGGFFLAPDQTTLAELLKARGYKTGAFVAAYVLAAKWGINQGFDTYFDDFDLSQTRTLSLSAIQRPANEVLDKALPWIEQAGNAPFFAWIHLYDPHAPYRPPEPFATRYKDHPYNGEIAFADSQISRLISLLRSKNLYDQTVVVVIGDHGESLGEHREGAHGFFVYNSVTRVPFIVRAPFTLTAHRRVADPVRSVDVMPTVLDLLAAPAPVGISGVSLVPLMTGNKTELGLDAYSEAMYPLHHYGWSDLHALRSGRYKVIDAPRPELYDVDRDPGETTNLFAERQALGDRMLAELRTLEGGFKKAVASMPAADVDPEARERLAALGYVGTFVASAADPRTGRADPKDKIGLFNKLNEATDITRDREDDPEGSFKRVISLLNDVIHQDPQVIDAWFMRGTKYLSHG